MAYFLVLTILLIVYFISTASGVTSCPPGQRMKLTRAGAVWGSGETECEPCPPGNYQDVANLGGSCKPCDECNGAAMSVLTSACTPTENTKCECIGGSTPTFPDDGESECSCPPGTLKDGDKCTNCPLGFTTSERNSGQCLFSGCPNGSTRMGEEERCCPNCPEKHILGHDCSCSCVFPKISNGTHCVCPKGMKCGGDGCDFCKCTHDRTCTVRGQHNRCLQCECQPPSFPDDDGNCICPSRMSMAHKRCTCTPPWVCEGENCESCNCPDGKKLDADGNCICMPPMVCGKKCRSCICPEKWISDGNGGCTKCEDGFYSDDTRTICKKDCVYQPPLIGNYNGQRLCYDGRHHDPEFYLELCTLTVKINYSDPESAKKKLGDTSNFQHCNERWRHDRITVEKQLQQHFSVEKEKRCQSYDPNSRRCKQCQAGWRPYKSGDESSPDLCKLCEENRWSSDGTNPSCRRCDTCVGQLFTKYECTPKTDTVCDCKGDTHCAGSPCTRCVANN